MDQESTANRDKVLEQAKAAILKQVRQHGHMPTPQELLTVLCDEYPMQTWEDWSELLAEAYTDVSNSLVAEAKELQRYKAARYKAART